MPVTVKLSKRFYDTFGEEIANEFVEWFNLVNPLDPLDVHLLGRQRRDLGRVIQLTR